MNAEFWVAAHLTGLFEINDHSKNLLEMGSRGAGICVQRGVSTSIQESDSSSVIVLFNGKKQVLSDAMITLKVIELLISEEEQKNFQIHHHFDVPIRSGFGASAAGALGTAFCINEYFKIGMNNLELFQVAHKAEILTKSGLGDIIGLFQGGLEIRTKEGAPGYGKTIIMQKNDNWKIATVSLGPLSTSSVLSNQMKRALVNKAGVNLINNLINNPEFDNFVHYSAAFTQDVHLCSPQLQTLLDHLPENILGAQIMLGDGAFLFYHEDDELAEINISSDLIHAEEICTKTIKRIS